MPEGGCIFFVTCVYFLLTSSVLGNYGVCFRNVLGISRDACFLWCVFGGNRPKIYDLRTFSFFIDVDGFRAVK